MQACLAALYVLQLRSIAVLLFRAHLASAKWQSRMQEVAVLRVQRIGYLQAARSSATNQISRVQNPSSFFQELVRAQSARLRCVPERSGGSVAAKIVFQFRFNTMFLLRSTKLTSSQCKTEVVSRYPTRAVCPLAMTCLFVSALSR